MTKSTLKTLWLAGGGLLATWFAVTPSDKGVAPPKPPSDHFASVILVGDDLHAQESKLRQHASAVAPKPTTRNPFRFGGQPATDTSRGTAPPVIAPVAVAPPRPSLTLAGIAEQTTSQGVVRTAVISGDGQLYLVHDGDAVAGRYHVIVVDSDAVTLRDDAGVDTRLVWK